VVGGLLGLALAAGIGPWMLANLAPALNQFLRGTALILLVSIVVHALLILPLFFIHRLLVRVTGVDVDD
jgi:hypothetical protein